MFEHIRIKDTPPGSAPPDIRKAWVGLVLPLATHEDIEETPPQKDLADPNVGGYLVCREQAIEALHEADKIEAADFWDFWEGTSKLEPYFLFAREVCEKIPSVEPLPSVFALGLLLPGETTDPNT